MGQALIERSRFLSWVNGAQDDALEKIMEFGGAVLTVRGQPVSVAVVREDGSRIEKVLGKKVKR